MSTAELDAQKAALARIILNETDEGIVKKVKAYIFKIKSLERNLKPMTMEEYYQMIDESIEDVKAGRVISAEDLRKEMAQWGTR